jgi:feruloyl esterase
MAPPHPEQLDTLRGRGAKLLMYHGTSDPIFSSDHSATAWTNWNQTYGGEVANFARLFLVPGMNHCSGGPSTDQFDMLDPLVAWVEQGQAPASVVATARGGANADVPTGWAANRTRPLCPYPLAARYNGSGDIDLAASFSCKK